MFVFSYIKGIVLGSTVYTIGRIADYTIAFTSYQELNKKKPLLLDQGIKACEINLILVGPLVYTFLDIFLISHNTTFYILDSVGIIFIHGVGYYIAHRLMHTNKHFYKFHTFHHKFDDVLIPSIGNAVSIQEFFIAYLLPFIVGAILLQPSELAFNIGIGCISFFNLVIHCMELEKIKYANYLVSPKKHITHHHVKEKHYAAPILDLDYILDNLAFQRKETVENILIPNDEIIEN
jgi:sterol desaturase/sphingolipid hydroxylase (fatty acid hydroxylase superfamily)